jgi:hypothetical protein
LGYNVLALTAASWSSGEIALFFRGNNLYKVEEMQIWRSNIISMHLMLGTTQFLSWGATSHPLTWKKMAHINRAWRECLKGAHPILVGNLNLNLCALRMEREEMIAKQVDAMALVNISRRFCHC